MCRRVIELVNHYRISYFFSGMNSFQTTSTDIACHEHISSYTFDNLYHRTIVCFHNCVNFRG